MALSLLLRRAGKDWGKTSTRGKTEQTADSSEGFEDVRNLSINLLFAGVSLVTDFRMKPVTMRKNEECSGPE